jgi:hypothetical protein
MDRLTNIDQGDFDRILAECQRDYPSFGDPLPGTALKLNDDIMWLGVIPARVLWGHDDPEAFNSYNAEYFGETNAVLEGQYITDRAPADAQETPMPIYPQQAQQPQRVKHDKKAALKKLLKQLQPEHQKKVRALFKQKKPELLDD